MEAFSPFECSISNWVVNINLNCSYSNKLVEIVAKWFSQMLHDTNLLFLINMTQILIKFSLILYHINLVLIFYIMLM